MLPLRELLRELEVRVVAGEAGLDRAVRWVHISELRDPTPWLSGGELLLTTGLQLGGDAEQREYVARLVRRGLTGLGFGSGFSHDAVPDALRAATLAALAAELRERTRQGSRRGYVPAAEAFDPPARALALPVARSPQPTRGDGPLPEAWLLAAKDAGPLSELDRLTLHQAVL